MSSKISARMSQNCRGQEVAVVLFVRGELPLDLRRQQVIDVA